MSKITISMLLKNRLFGLVLVFILSIVILAVFYGKVILSLNTTFFSTGGDGILSYYNSYYLAKYDTSLMYSHSINYPYGEVAFYTQSQPLVAGIAKFISENFTDVTAYTVGLLNFLMLFSIVLAAVFLYLFLAETGLPVHFALFISVGIAFLSPQIDRFGGHFTLAYVCAIPLLLYLLLMFHKKKSKIKYSLMTGVVLFFLMTGHVYFAAFFTIAIIVYWLIVIIKPENGGSKLNLKMVLHMALQLIIPVLVFYLITSLYSHLSPDRPAKPYGFLVYKASPESVLLPIWVDYGKFLHKIRSFNYVQWEGVSYVGLMAAIGFFMILAGIVKKMYRQNWKAIFQVTDHYFINSMFWSSFIALLYSFGIPFIFGLDFLIDYLGPLQQMRAIGRFAWLFYFMVNIVVFYNLWHWQPNRGRHYLRITTLVLGIIVLYADVYFFLKNRQDSLNNHFPSWSDTKNVEPDNQWVAHINPGQYQAIIPLPFYHMGSDNYGITPRCDMLANSFLVAMKTGLPVTAIYMSRASITQSIKNIALVMEPYRDLAIMKDFPDKKPFLIVAGRCNDYTPEEKNLLHLGIKIDSNTYFNLYRLAFDSLLLLPQKKSKEIVEEFGKFQFQKHETIYKSNPAAKIVQVTYDSQGEGKGYQGKALQVTGRSKSILFDNPLQIAGDSTYSLSFWFSPINVDLFPKTRLAIEWYNVRGERYDDKNIMLGTCIKTIDGPWGLIEYSFQIANPGDRVKITVYNTQIGRKKFYQIDELLIRPDDCDVYYSRDNYVYKNNRWFYLRKENKAITEVPGK